jgi:hypothetical protein
MARSLKELALEALAVQDACNLSGVAHSFSRAMRELRDMDAEPWNGHPIMILWASKIASLTHCEDQVTFAKAYAACRELAGK